MTELIDTLNNGETDVLVVPKGQFYGSDSEGNPIPEAIDETVIDTLAEQLKDKELLVDKDHSSVKKGTEKDTSAMGWMHSFKKGIEGLWAKISWTNIGRNLVENRVFRFLSPVFTLHGDKPTNMLNVSLTNQPAFQDKAKPIINNKPNMEELEMTITKEELVSLIKETVASMNSEQKTDTQEMKNADCSCDPTTDEKVENECGKTDKMVENECGKKADVTKNEEVIEDGIKEDIKEEIQEGKEEGKTKEEVKREIKEEIAEEKADKEDDEVIKIEALNSAPTALKDVSGKADWMSLHGSAFWDYLAKHPEIRG